MGSINTTKGKNNVFADANVGGSKYLPVGTHKNVRITEANDVLLGAINSPALQLVFESEDGRMARTTLFYIQNVFVKGQRTDDTELSWKLRLMTGALVKDEALRGELFGMCYDDTSHFEKLVGFRCNIEIAYPKKGYAILRDSDAETIGVYDLGNDRELIQTFESFDDAKAYMEEESLPRAYTDIVDFSKTSTDGGEDINAKLIQSFIKAASGSAKGGANVAPLGRRANGPSM
jgi:hypothetical protein